MGCGFTGGHESGCVFGAVVCKIQANSTTLSLFHQCQKINEAGFLKCPLYSCLLIVCLPSGSKMLSRNTHAQSMPRTEEYLEMCK